MNKVNLIFIEKQKRAPKHGDIYRSIVNKNDYYIVSNDGKGLVLISLHSGFMFNYSTNKESVEFVGRDVKITIEK